MKGNLNISSYRLPVLLVALSLLAACSSTRYVPEGKYLLNDVDIKVDHRSINKEELKGQVRQKENLKILGFFKFHLALYNLSSKKKDNNWFKRIGEAPVIYQDFQTVRSKEQLGIYLKNKGFYDGVITDTVIQHARKPKVNLVFNVKAGEPYRIRKYEYQIEDEKLAPLIMADTARQLMGVNDIFDIDRLNEERNRLSALLRNHGYYRFSTDYISYLADSSLNTKQVDLAVVVADADQAGMSDSVVAHRKFVVRNYRVNPDYVPPQLAEANNRAIPDTIFEPPYTFIFREKLKYKPELFENLNRIKDSTEYSLRNVEKTYRSLNQLQQFKVVNLNFNVVDSLGNDSIGVLDCNFQLTPLSRQGFSVDVEGTNSSGNLGMAGNLNYQHRNLFRGAEIFNVTLKGAIERQQALVSESRLNFNTREFGLEGSLTLPKFFSPLDDRRLFSFQVPQTSFTLGYNYQRRPDYTRTITNFRFGYNWKSKAFRTHFLNLIDFNYVNLYEFNPEFINSIEDLYIKSSFTDHLIMAMNYTLVDNTQSVSRKDNYHYFKWSFEAAGNLFSAYARMIGKKEVVEMDSLTNHESRYYKMLNTRFAQYLKTDLEYRYGYTINKYNSIVGRAFAGVGLPYGNFDVLPFEKKYFTGGANGIRAWQVRTLGPGSYKAPENVYPNQSGDIKLEANLEYRYRLVGRVEGAFFLDAGNIWAINNKDNRPGALFQFDNFYKQVAIGTGTGFRFDFTYFIFRLDLGMKLRDPALPQGKRFIIGNYPITGDHFNLSFAIGYPF
ncbi:MAG: BamA/TamA family outer membrane protein [Mangrovibacterium sp.]